MESASSNLTVSAAADLAVEHAMASDERVVVMCTDPPANLRARFPATRVRRIPISEAAATGIAVGAAIRGLRPVMMWRNISFSYVAYDQVANQAAKVRFMSGGQTSVPAVFRGVVGGGVRMAAQHSQTPIPMFASVPGLRVFCPATPDDAYEMMLAAIRDPDPVVFLESLRIPAGQVQLGERDVALIRPRIVRLGRDATVVAIGEGVSIASKVIDRLDAGTSGTSVELIDLRAAAPLDVTLALESVRRTGRLVVVDGSPRTCSIGSEVVARIAADPTANGALHHPPVQVAGGDLNVAYAPALEDEALITEQAVEHALGLVLGTSAA